MKTQKLLVMLLSFAFANNAAAYGSSGGGSKKACKPPKFSQFNPPPMSRVSSGTEFSFTASANTLPDTIKVRAKSQPVEVSVIEKNKKYIVTGTLPESVNGTHARIKIEATGSNQCKGSGGWLLKLENK